MKMKSLLLVVAASLGLCGAAQAASWTLVGDASHLAYGSIKKDSVGEVNTFETLSGSVTDAGAVSVKIDLTSLETNIDIRNERMLEHVFKGMADATITTQVEMPKLENLAPGETMMVDIEGVLSFLGTDIEIEAEMVAVRISDTRVMISTNDMIFLSMEDAGVNAAIDKLMELASLPGITRTVPVTMRLVFEADAQKAEVAPAAPAPTEVALAGDVTKGKKVFKKCKACHKLKEGKSGTGPTLHGIINAQAGQVEGFKYSKAMLASGLTWTPDVLAEFLAKPKKLVPGTKMSFSGLKKASQIEDLIAYLAENT